MSAGTRAGARPDTRPDTRQDVRLWLRLLGCATLIERRLGRLLRARFRTTLPRFDVLAQLDREPEGLSMGALSQRLMVSNGNVTGLVERLAAEGLVERRADRTDRRSQRVRLTAAGRRAFARMAPAHEQWVAEALAGLAPEDKARLIALLDGLKTRLSEDAFAS